MLKISFGKRLLIFMGFPLFVVARKDLYYVTFFAGRNFLGKKDKVVAVVNQRFDFKFLFTGRIPSWKI